MSMIKILASSLAFAVGLISICGNVSAQACPGAAGCLDPSFGIGGKVTYPFISPSGPVPLDMEIQTDGKIVELLSDNKLIRLNSDGALDSTFGIGGVVSISWTFASGSTTYTGAGNAMRLQDVGGQQRIVVAGAGHRLSGRKVIGDLRVGRFMPDGSVDMSFGTSGSSLLNIGTAATEVEIQADGKIVMLDDRSNIVRTSANGSLDPAFGIGGIVNTGYLKDIAVDANGGILVGGDLTIGKGSSTKVLMAVKRYTSAGVADNAFGSGGIATADFSATNNQVGKLSVDPFGNIVVAGHVTAPGFAQAYFAAARFTSNGLPDTSFGGTGKVKYVGASGSGRGALVQSDGKVVLTGSLNSNYGLVRYNYNGTLDATFGVGGMISEDGNGMDYVSARAIQMDPACACSKIVMSSYGGIGSPGVSFARFIN